MEEERRKDVDLAGETEDSETVAAVDEQEKNEPDGDDAEQAQGNKVARLYDRLPITFKQADIIAKVAIGVTVVVILIAILMAGGSN